MSKASSSTSGGTLTYKAGAEIFRQDEAASRVFVINEGHVRLERRIFQEHFVLESLGPGSIIGEVALVPDATYPTTAVAVDEVKVIAVPREDMEGRIQKNPDLAMKMARKLAVRLAQSHFRLANFALRKPASRVMLQLRFEAARRESLDGETFVPLPFDLPEVLATEQATVEDALRALAQEGLIELDGDGRFRIHRIDAFDRKLHYLELADRFEGGSR
ncbi:MAG: Crp/Fnr family transcriptional regulator [Deltaproteobacteria bacterium]|nr:MAG: Crp/Fnr family transcriptional regulator [Deltaproteobacteria bacterium]